MGNYSFAPLNILSSVYVASTQDTQGIQNSVLHVNILSLQSVSGSAANSYI